MSIVAVVCACVSACSSDDPEPTPNPPHDPKENGEVVFDITLPTGTGSGTAESPAEVKKGETLDMTISQKSSYTDPDGTVFTCEPKAEIVLSAKLDTVVAKDIASLTKVKDASDVKSNTSGTSPVRHQTLQTFEIGGQNIVFDLSHEVYTYINSMKDKIEMPYIKINQAKLGNTYATEESPEGRSTAVAFTGVTVRPLVTSRATTITDSTMYEVNAKFNLDIASVNAKSDAKQTLVFSVTYIGIVETVTELKDPEGVVSFAWDVKSGTNSTVSPFEKLVGSPMEVWMKQSSRYTDEYGNEATGEPNAKIKISVAQDTIWTNSGDELEKIVDKTDGASNSQAVTQVFESGEQVFTIDWSYEVATGEIAGTKFEMPYYVLDNAKLTNVSVKEAGQKVYQNKDADLYEVTATFRQKATPKNITGEAVAEEIEYIVSYVGAVAIKKDPESVVSYVWDVKSGTNSTESPFVKLVGSPMEVWMKQSSRYTNEYGTTVTGEPNAKIKVSVAQDTIWTNSGDELKSLAAKSSDTSNPQAATQVFESGAQTVTIDWSYDVATAKLDEKDIEIPYYALGEATLADVSVKEAGYMVYQDKEADLYEVTATFRQKATPKNVTGEAVAEEIEYIVSYVGAVEIKLVQVEYVPSGEWVDPHDNMALAYYPVVTRKRIYSNGVVQEDEFYDYGHFIRPYPGSDYIPERKEYNEGTWAVFLPYHDVDTGDSIVIRSSATQVSHLASVSHSKITDKYMTSVQFMDWSKYDLSRPVNEAYNLTESFGNSSYPKDDRLSSWYFQNFKYKCTYNNVWVSIDNHERRLGNILIVFDFYDQFLVIDGLRIDFSKLHKLKMNYSFSESSFSDSQKEGTVAKLELHASYLGKNFYSAHIDSVYVAK